MNGEAAGEARGRLANTIVSFLEADATAAEVASFIARLPAGSIHAIEVNLSLLEEAQSILDGRDTLLSTVISYPLGCMTTEVKEYQVSYAAAKGAAEVFVQLNYNAVSSRDWRCVRSEIRRLAAMSTARLVVVPIVEVSLLTNEQKITLRKILEDEGARAVKLGSEMVGAARWEDAAVFFADRSDRIHRVDAYFAESPVAERESVAAIQFDYLHRRHRMIEETPVELKANTTSTRNGGHGR